MNMSVQISDKSVEVIQQLVHDAFNNNAILDRIKSVLNSELAYPILSGIVHKRAHNFAVGIGDTLGDIIEERNIVVNYGGIDKHYENYSNVQEAIDKVYEAIQTYQIELNTAYETILNNKDYHILSEIQKVIDINNEYVKKVILWKDIVDKYGDTPMLDVVMKEYE